MFKNTVGGTEWFRNKNGCFRFVSARFVVFQNKHQFAIKAKSKSTTFFMKTLTQLWVMLKVKMYSEPFEISKMDLFATVVRHS